MNLAANERLRAVDWLRGLVMVLMVIDHVRVFSGVPAGGADPAVFFTRWVTHFCAPLFVFLAGTSIWLRALKRDDTSRYLLTRGLMLIVLEFTLIRLSWTFNLDYAHYALAGVIWVIGLCMVLMAGLVRLGERAVLAIGVVVVFGHNLLDFWLPGALDGLMAGSLAPLWKLLYVGPNYGPISIGSLQFSVLYSLLPWIGVMALGYAFAPVLAWPFERRCHRAVPGPARQQSVWRSEPVDGGRRQGGLAVLPRDHEIPRLAGLPADDDRSGPAGIADGGSLARFRVGRVGAVRP